jgi:GH25 family lysozyme M1 (1,4-beta-N-acetylmuramidase)
MTVSAIDVASWQPRDLSTLIAEFRPAHVVVKLYLPGEVISQDHTRSQVESARANGCTVGGYVFCYAAFDPRQTVRDALALARSCGLRLPVLWLDAETYEGTWPDVAWLREAVDECRVQGVQPGIYTGRWFWEGYLGNPEDFGDLPLWTAEYQDGPDIEGLTLYGSWRRASGHQWTSTPVDQNVFREAVTVLGRTEQQDSIIGRWGMGYPAELETLADALSHRAAVAEAQAVADRERAERLRTVAGEMRGDGAALEEMWPAV